MNYRPLGNTGLDLSVIGYGCMSLKETNATNTLLLQKAVASGINYFDTADIYQQGGNERLVGKALRAHRHEILLATKVGNRYRADGKTLDWVPSKKYILSSVEESLQRLQTDYIDLYQLHGGTMEDPIDEIIEAFNRLQEQGKIRHYGISSIRPNVIRTYAARARIASVMMQYSLLDRRPEETCFPLLASANISVLVRGAIAQGLLIDKPAVNYLGHSETAVAAARQSVSAQSASGDPAATAIRFALSPSPVASVIVGMRSEAQLEDALQAAAAGNTAFDPSLLAEAAPPLLYTQHR